MGTVIIDVLLYALSIFRVIVIAMIIYSWLYSFNVINSSNRFVALLGDFLYRATEPFLRPIRRFMPDLGGIDISPIILFIGIYAVELTLDGPLRNLMVGLLG